MTATVFISHSSKDDDFVRALREALALHGMDGWIDSRELRGGEPLWETIKAAIDAANGFAVVITPASFQSEWVSDELEYAVEQRDQRGPTAFPVVPICLDGTKLGAFKRHFGAETKFLGASSSAGGIEAAINDLLIAFGKRLPADVASVPQPKAEPLEELVLELTDLKFHEQDGVKRASAKARLVYEPATAGQPEVLSAKAWRFVAPIGPIEADDLRWYLEQYAIWPAGVSVIQDRARKVETNLVTWGRLLHDAAMPVEHVTNVKEAWAKISDQAGRRFSVNVDAALEAGAPEDQVKEAKEVATLLLGLPWELLHDGKGHLFQGAKPTRVRRRLPFTEHRVVPVVAPPIRILLISARPEDDACGYIDHRASALPLVEAMESLPGLVQLHVLARPTLPALRAELDRAREAKQPYHVVHFDGHGVYNAKIGLGGLCFEHPDDTDKLEKRRHLPVYTEDSTEHGTGLGSLLRAHRIPLVFLEACQTAMSEKASESVATKLLNEGVASVVAMSHSVLVKTAEIFVEEFYKALAAGKRVGDAMLAGQRRLKDDTSRGRIFGADELRLEDWFVPVLFQEKDDPQLFTKAPARQTVEDFRAALATRLGDLPKPPETKFIGRSRELLALQRLLYGNWRGTGVPPVIENHGLEAHATKWVVIRGQGGEGKTTLAAEFARWMVRSHQVRRAAFVCVEGLERNIAEAVLDKLGGQLVKRGFLTQADSGGDIERATQAIERALREQSTLLVVDNMESILLPAWVAETTPEALTDAAREELQTLLALCQRLLKAGETRLIFTSREALPAPFDAARQRRELYRLDPDDAVKLVERALNADLEPSPPRGRGCMDRGDR